MRFGQFAAQVWLVNLAHECTGSCRHSWMLVIDGLCRSRYRIAEKSDSGRWWCYFSETSSKLLLRIAHWQAWCEIIAATGFV